MPLLSFLARITFNIDLHTTIFYAALCVFSIMQTGATPLILAADQGSKECLKLLVHEYNADPEEVDLVSSRAA